MWKSGYVQHSRASRPVVATLHERAGDISSSDSKDTKTGSSSSSKVRQVEWRAGPQQPSLVLNMIRKHPEWVRGQYVMVRL